jgi:hypothetical protein
MRKQRRTEGEIRGACSDDVMAQNPRVCPLANLSVHSGLLVFGTVCVGYF